MQESLKSLYPQISKQWHPTKNKGVKPEDITTFNKKVWWLGDCGHEYMQLISNKIKGIGCPVCSNRQAQKGVNDLESQYKEIADEWNYDRNGKLIPEKFSYSSSKKVWWRCDAGHEWENKIVNRTLRKQGCPYCSGRFPIIGETDLATTNPEILSQWDYSKNNVLPSSIKKGSHYMAWWVCDNNHSYQMTPLDRIKGSGCPYCKNKKVLAGFNDLATTNPELLKDFDYERNKFKPTEIIAGSDKFVSWKCHECGHLWTAKCNSRAKQKIGCPNCMKYYSTSFPEQAIYYYLAKSGIEVLNKYMLNKMELDIFLANKKVAIEYDGFQWHKDKIDEDNKKDIQCEKKGIMLIRIREFGLNNTISATNIFRKNRLDSDLSETINKLFEILKIDNCDIDIYRDKKEIISNYMSDLKDKSLQSQYVEIASEWDFEKNGRLKPHLVYPTSNEKVWWKCKVCNNNWETSISNRVKHKSGCPVCSMKSRTETKRLNKQLNGDSLFDKFPLIADEWDYEKNELTPKDVLYGESLKVWWKCPQGHNYFASINSRTHMNSGCPKCYEIRRKNTNGIKVLNIDTNEVFDSLAAAARKYNVSAANISNCCKGKHKTIGGFRWKYVE